MLSGPGQLNESVRMEKQQRQGGNDSRLSLGQCFSNEGRRSSARLRHQSLDRGMQRPSLGLRTVGADDKLHTAARSV